MVTSSSGNSKSLQECFHQALQPGNRIYQKDVTHISFTNSMKRVLLTKADFLSINCISHNSQRLENEEDFTHHSTAALDVEVGPDFLAE